ncbi:TPA: IS1380 family transposase, partial [Escherichia coli]
MISLSPPTICNSAKTFRLKYVFLAAKIIKTARYVIMKLSENYPYKGVYEKCLV